MSVRVIGYKTRMRVTRSGRGQRACDQAQVTVCWSRLLKALRKKRHPRSFIELREALAAAEDDWIVKELDDQSVTEYTEPSTISCNIIC